MCVVLSFSVFTIHISLQYSWKWFVYNRAQNVNKIAKHDKSTDGPSPSKRLKLSGNDQHFYPVSIPATTEDDESRQHNHSRLNDEIAKAKPSADVLKELMTRTYPDRRVWITKTSPPPSLSEIMSDYPHLAPLVCSGRTHPKGHVY